MRSSLASASQSDMGRSSCRARLYQVQAAIAALHARARRAEETDWSEIALLYGTSRACSRLPWHAQSRCPSPDKIPDHSVLPCAARTLRESNALPRVVLCSGLLAIAFT
jgi:hypothetical protein